MDYQLHFFCFSVENQLLTYTKIAHSVVRMCNLKGAFRYGRLSPYRFQKISQKYFLDDIPLQYV